MQRRSTGKPRHQARSGEIHLTDAQEMHRRSPETFWVPSDDTLSLVGPGWSVKVCVNDRERMWVDVTEVTDDAIIGTLFNQPVMVNVPRGAVIRLEKRHVYDVLLPEMPCHTCGNKTRGWSRDAVPECSDCRLAWAKTQRCCICNERLAGEGDDFAFCGPCWSKQAK